MKSVLITGSYGAIGIEIAKGLAASQYRLFLVGRESEKLVLLRKSILSENTDCECFTYSVDLSSKTAIASLAESINEKIDVLINNAATAPVRKLISMEGIEIQWATNVLGYYWMIKAFENHLMRSDYPRIVNVASYWAGGLDLGDPEFKNRVYNNDLAYRQSKQADRMLTYGFAELFKDTIAINACHPGDANSKLSNDLGFGGSESAKKAAETPLILAKSALGIENTGRYFENCRLSACRFSQDKSAINQLLKICEKY